MLMPFWINRLSPQVVSWGESLFIQNGINIINPIDVSQLRVAGAELRDALLPVPMVYVSTDITDNISIEGFYQFYWEQTEVEASGTFFSSNDYIGPGGSTIMLGFGLPPVSDNPLTAVGTNPPLGAWAQRSNDNKASNMGQGGLAMRFFAPFLNDSEFGLYWIHYHSRLPLLSGVTGNAPPDDYVAQVLLFSLPEQLNLDFTILDKTWDYASTAKVIREYPEDIDVLGVSFNTSFDPLGISLQGEFSWRPNQPLQMDDAEVLFAAFSPMDPKIQQLAAWKTFFADPGAGFPAVSTDPVFGNSQVAKLYGPYGFNEYIRGWIRKDVIQPQMTFFKVFGPMLGMDQLVVLGEVGMTYVIDMESKDKLRYEGPATYTFGNPYFKNVFPDVEIQEDGFADAFSMGYRIATRATFNNAIGPVTLMPAGAFYHDVEGTSPTPILNFVEGRKSVSISLTADYLSKIKGKIAYTNYFGGEQFNQIRDRDFVSLAMSYSF